MTGREPSVADLAYFAGFFDGEGSISLSLQSNTKGKRKRRAYYLRITIVNTYLPTLQWIKSLWGLGTINPHCPEEGLKPRWEWRASSNQALHILRATLPFLQVKREQVEIAIAFQELKSRVSKTCGNAWMPNSERVEEKRLVELLSQAPVRQGVYSHGNLYPNN